MSPELGNYNLNLYRAMSIRQKLSGMSVLKNRSIIPPKLRLKELKQVFSRLGIRQKIAYGYALAIGIAVIGATAANLIENYYQERAKKQLTESQEIISLLNKLESAVLQAHTQTPKLLPLLTEPIRLELEYSRFLEYIAAVNRILNKTKSLLDSEASKNQDTLLALEDNKKLKLSIQTYIDSIKEYSQRLEIITKGVDLSTIKQERVQVATLVNINAKSNLIDLKINKVSQEMSSLIADIQQKEANKTLQILDKANEIGDLVLYVSLLAAAAIGAVLAYYTSRVIAYPIEATTKVAQQVTKESNFTLQAPVITEDEVGLLTTSLNQLIQRVLEYTKELKQAQSQLIQTEKMSSLGQMVAGIAHEINNPVSFIYGNVQHINGYVNDLLELVHLYEQKYPKPNPEIQDLIERIDLEFIAEDLPKSLTSMKVGAERIRQLVVSLRNFSRLDEAELKAVDLHEGIDSTLVILNNRFKEKIQLHKRYGNLPLVECHPAQLNQVFMNILSNAIDALLNTDQPNKQITIQTEALSPDEVMIKIRDNGQGIPAEIKQKIFDPFFTTKPVGKGTGLGLSISYQIIENHGGQICCNSVLGEGTEFTIVLRTSKAIALAVKQPVSS